MLRATCNQLRHNPGHTLAVVATVAAALVVAIAALSVVSAFLLRPLPIDGLDRLARLREARYAEDGSIARQYSLSAATLRLWRERNTVFSGIAAGTADARSLTGGDGVPERLPGARVTTDFFQVLGLRAERGRTFSPDEPADRREVVISDALWRRRFAADPEIVGRSLELDGERWQVIGVLPRGIHHPYDADYWLPLDLGDEAFRPGGNYLYAPARLRPGVDRAEAERAMRRLATELRREAGDLTRAEGAVVRPLRDELLRDLVPVVAWIGGSALLVVLLGLVNLTNLLLARALRDAPRAAVRWALGARRGRLLAEALLRNGLLVGAAAALAIPAAAVLVPSLAGFVGLSALREFDAGPRLDATTVVLTLAVAALLAALLAAVEVAFQGRVASPAALAAGGRGRSPGRRASRAMRGLAVAQMALSFALLAVAATVAADYRELVAGDPGYGIADRALMDVGFSATRFPDTPSRVRAVERVEAELAKLPGVTAVAASTVTPDYAGSWGASYRVPGQDPRRPGEERLTNLRLVSPGYFAAMGIERLAGRDFTAREMHDPETGSVIVSRDLAREAFGTADAVGRRLLRVSRDGEAPRRLTVVGVVDDVEESIASEFWPVRHAWYLPLSVGTDYDLPGVTLVVRTAPGVAPPRAGMRRAAVAVDPTLAPGRLATLRERLVEVHPRHRLSAFTYALFAAVALVVAAVGLFSLQWFLVHGRLRELAVRLSVGATPARLFRRIVGEGLALGALALGAGAPLLWAGVRLYHGFVGGGGGAESWAVVAAAAVLVLAAVAATLAPALRASRLEPREVLQLQ